MVGFGPVNTGGGGISGGANSGGNIGGDVNTSVGAPLDFFGDDPAAMMGGHHQRPQALAASFTQWLPVLVMAALGITFMVMQKKGK